MRSVAGCAFARFLLRELVDERRLLPDLLVEHAIDFRRLIDADRRDRIALAMIVGGDVLVGLGKAEARAILRESPAARPMFSLTKKAQYTLQEGTNLRETLMRLVTRCLLLTTLMTAACSGSNTTAPSTSSGTFTQTDLVVGTGAEAAPVRRATVTYSGWLYDTTKPDSKGSFFDGRPGFQFTLGAGSGDHRLGSGRRRHAGGRTAPSDHSARTRVRFAGTLTDSAERDADLRHHPDRRAVT